MKLTFLSRRIGNTMYVMAEWRQNLAVDSFVIISHSFLVLFVSIILIICLFTSALCLKLFVYRVFDRDIPIVDYSAAILWFIFFTLTDSGFLQISLINLLGWNWKYSIFELNFRRLYQRKNYTKIFRIITTNQVNTEGYQTTKKSHTSSKPQEMDNVSIGVMNQTLLQIFRERFTESLMYCFWSVNDRTTVNNQSSYWPACSIAVRDPNACLFYESEIKLILNHYVHLREDA